jgi:hypothetical protein
LCPNFEVFSTGTLWALLVYGHTSYEEYLARYQADISFKRSKFTLTQAILQVAETVEIFFVYLGRTHSKLSYPTGIIVVFGTT